MMLLDGLGKLLAQPKLARLLALLDGDGEETRIVGGAVRNVLMGIPASEVDLATTALPDVVTSRARRAGLTIVPTGIAHGTVTVLIEGTPFEVTTLRRDVATDGRHAVVVFGRDFTDDSQRRDFTINALSLSRDGTLHDPIGGLPDLEARRVRFIGDPQTRIREDFLRILRLFRFHAAYGEGPLDVAARNAAITERAGLARLSAERINVELSKLLVARRAAAAVTEMADAGLLHALLGGVAYTDRFMRATTIDPGSDAVARLAALAVAVREDVQRLRARLRLSNAATKRLDEMASILEAHRGGASFASSDVDALLFKTMSRTAARDALVILHAQSCSAIDNLHWQRLRSHAAQADIPHLPVTGDELLDRGMAPGRGVGAALKSLQARWIRAGFPREPAAIAELVESVLQDTPSQ